MQTLANHNRRYVTSEEREQVDYLLEAAERLTVDEREFIEGLSVVISRYGDNTYLSLSQVIWLNDIMARYI